MNKNAYKSSNTFIKIKTVYKYDVIIIKQLHINFKQ